MGLVSAAVAAAALRRQRQAQPRHPPDRSPWTSGIRLAKTGPAEVEFATLAAADQPFAAPHPEQRATVAVAAGVAATGSPPPEILLHPEELVVFGPLEMLVAAVLVHRAAAAPLPEAHRPDHRREQCQRIDPYHCCRRSC
uniref:Putative secreted protein n=1 Tax=Anopheles triannulatus TaxID=58253 RepID=A0A2M4B158_9DIPT